MLIVEGPDGAGKTTLIAQLEADWGLTREPRAVSKDAKSLVPIDDYIETELEKGFGFRLYDRFALISSPQYMALPNRTFAGRMTDVDWLSQMHHKFKKIDPVVILCLPPLQTVLRNTQVDTHDGLDMTQHIETVYLHYLNWFAERWYNSSMMIYNYEDPNMAKLSGLMRWAHARAAEETNGEERRRQKWKTGSD